MSEGLTNAYSAQTCHTHWKNDYNRHNLQNDSGDPSFSLMETMLSSAPESVCHKERVEGLILFSGEHNVGKQVQIFQ